MTRLLVAVYFIETGVLLIVGPWTIWWRRNFFADLYPWLPALMASGVFRVGVSLIGLVTMGVGLNEVRRLIFRRIAPQRPVGGGDSRLS